MRSSALVRPDAERQQRFSQAFNRLWGAMSQGQPDAAKMAVYYQALNDLPIESIEKAALWLSRNGGAFLPTAAQWHERALLEQDALLRQHVHTSREEPWHVECEACDDTGWERHDCPGGSLCPCGRNREHGPISFVTPCACRATNRTYQRQRERERTR